MLDYMLAAWYSSDTTLKLILKHQFWSLRDGRANGHRVLLQHCALEIYTDHIFRQWMLACPPRSVHIRLSLPIIRQNDVRLTHTNTSQYNNQTSNITIKCVKYTCIYYIYKHFAIKYLTTAMIVCEYYSYIYFIYYLYSLHRVN